MTDDSIALIEIDNKHPDSYIEAEDPWSFAAGKHDDLVRYLQMARHPSLSVDGFSKVIKAAERAHLWPELVFLFFRYDEFVSDIPFLPPSDPITINT